MLTYATAKEEFLDVNGITEGVPLLLIIHFSGTMDHWDPTLVDPLPAKRPMILIDRAASYLIDAIKRLDLKKASHYYYPEENKNSFVSAFFIASAHGQAAGLVAWERSTTSCQNRCDYASCDDAILPTKDSIIMRNKLSNANSKLHIFPDAKYRFLYISIHPQRW
ncbi:Alpha/Beta hydrolase protein [Trichoderma austrokoningii]